METLLLLSTASVQNTSQSLTTQGLNKCSLSHVSKKEVCFEEQEGICLLAA